MFHPVSQSASATSTNLDDVCKLVRNTGFFNGIAKKPVDYPEEYFKRLVTSFFSSFVFFLLSII